MTSSLLFFHVSSLPIRWFSEESFKRGLKHMEQSQVRGEISLPNVEAIAE